MNKKDTFRATMGVSIINTICTLNCRKCITFTPYHKKPQNYDLANIKKEIEMFFKIYDEVDHYDFEGGETLLHPDLEEIIKYTLTYRDKYKTINILTNGTRLLSETQINLFRENPIFFIIDNYGPNLSIKKEELIMQLEDNNIEYRVDTYCGDDQYYGGWIDFGDMSRKDYSEDQLRESFSNCRSGVCGAPYIKNGKIYLCPVQASELEHIELIKGEYIDLFDENSTLEEMKEIASNFGKNPINSCRYCFGFNVNGKRIDAAEQISKDNQKMEGIYACN